MKGICLTGWVLIQSAWGLCCSAQGITAVTRRTLVSPLPAGFVFFQAPSSAANPAPPIAQNSWVVSASQLSDSSLSEAAKAQVARKTLEFQMKRAEAGAAHAQYDLGVRYLKGDGVEKNLDTARKWLAAAARNGNNQAVKKLEEMNPKATKPDEIEK